MSLACVQLVRAKGNRVSFSRSFTVILLPCVDKQAIKECCSCDSVCIVIDFSFYLEECKTINSLVGAHKTHINAPAHVRKPLSCCNPAGCGSVLFMVRLVRHTLKHFNHTLYTGDCFDECCLMSGGRLHLLIAILCVYVQWD